MSLIKPPFISLQTPTDTATYMEQVKFTKMTVDGLWTRHVLVRYICVIS